MTTPAPDGGRVGAARAFGLIAATVVAMLGVVFAVNPARYGGLGAALGALLVVVGLSGAVLLFRGRGSPSGP